MDVGFAHVCPLHPFLQLYSEDNAQVRESCQYQKSLLSAVEPSKHLPGKLNITLGVQSS